MRVGLLYDSFLDNVGDIAMGDAAIADGAGTAGCARSIFASDGDQVFDAVIVGGGELLRPTGDAFYDRFRAREGTMLNACGIWSDANELDYLGGYAMVSWYPVPKQ